MRLITLFLVLSTPFRAYGIDLTDPRQLHDVAHAGGGFAVQTTAYGLVKGILGSETKVPNLFISLAATALVAGAWELKGPSKPSGRDFGMSMAGAAGASLTILAFGF